MLSTAPPTRLEQETQSQLAELLAERVRSVSARAGTTQRGTARADSTVLVLLRSVGLADLVHGARQFAATLEPADAVAWLGSWTRTRFLFGNPANLNPQNRPRVVAPGATAAWLGPFPDSHRPGLSRLLKPVTGRLPELPRDLDLPADQPADQPGDQPGAGPRRVLRIAVAELSLADYLVHLHHSLAEAVLLGRLQPDEPLRLSHRKTLAIDSTSGRPAYARVLPDRDGGRLRLHTWLSAA